MLLLDAFAVPSLHGKHDLFNKFASSKNKFDDSNVYQHVYATTFGNYSFNGVDFAPNPGPARPFNFFGVPDQVLLLCLGVQSELGVIIINLT